MFTSRTSLLALAFAALATAIPIATPAQVTLVDNDTVKLYMTVDTVGTVQILNNYDTYNAAGLPIAPITPGFQNAFGNMGFGAYFGKNKEVEMYYELYLDTWNHTSQTYGHEGYIIIHDIPGQAEGLSFMHGIFKFIDIKVGHMELDFGDAWLHRSNNGNTKRNPLIGNFVMDPNTTEIGGELRSKPAMLNWLVGISSGTTTENWSQDHGTALHAKLWAMPIEPLRLAASYYHVDHSKSPVTGGAVSTFFSGNRSGARYEGVFLPGVTPAIRKNMTAWQGDITWKGKCFKGHDYYVYGNYGQVADKDVNASGAYANLFSTTVYQAPKLEEKWSYYALESSYDVTKNLYVAARYSAAQAKTLNNAATTCLTVTATGACSNPAIAAPQNYDTSGRIDRWQLGMGYRLSKNLTFKTEVVNQQFHGWRAPVAGPPAVTGEIYGGVQAWKNPGYHGVMMEVALFF